MAEMSGGQSAENGAPINLCYRARWATPHQPHTWRNGIEVQYEVRCPGYVIPPAKPATEEER